MHAAGARPRRLQAPLLGDVQLGPRPARSHLVHVHRRRSRSPDARTRARDACRSAAQHRVGGRERRDAERDRAEAANLVLRRHRAAVPRVRLAGAPIVDEREPLALRILEVERQPAVALRDLAGAHAELAQPRLPVVERVGAGHAQRRARDRARPARLRGHRPVEEGEVGSGRPLRVGVEQVIGTHVVLVDGALDEPHAQRPGIEVMVVPDLRRDRRQMVDSLQLDAHVGSLVVSARSSRSTLSAQTPCAPFC